jgi:predicted amidohydrolase YtcJ
VFRGLGVIDENGDVVGDSVKVEDSKIRGVSKSKYSKLVEVDGYILPAFIDAHLHLVGIGASLYGIDLTMARSIDEMVRRMSKSVRKIVFARGWNQELLQENRFPTRQDLDRHIPDRPAIAVRVCGHAAVVNSKALKMFPIPKKYKDLVDADKGWLFEDAVYYVVNKVMERLGVVNLVRTAVKALREAGVAGAASMACSSEQVEALKTLDSNGELPIYVSCYVHESLVHRTVHTLGHRFSIEGVKMFADGSLGARTAFLREPYSDDPGNRGKRLLTSRDIVATAREAFSRSLRIAVHAIGDAALDEVIEALEELDPQHKARVEHASIAHDSQIRKLSSLRVYVVVQPRFRLSDWWIGKRLGGRARLAYRFRTMVSSDVRVALSTDAPVERFEPWETFRVAIGDCEGRPCEHGEDLDPKTVIRLYTASAASATGILTRHMGSLTPGSVAALAYTPSDPLSSKWMGPLRPLYGF